MTIDPQVLERIRNLYFVKELKNMKLISSLTNVSYNRVREEISRAKSGKLKLM